MTGSCLLLATIIVGWFASLCLVVGPGVFAGRSADAAETIPGDEHASAEVEKQAAEPVRERPTCVADYFADEVWIKAILWEPLEMVAYIVRHNRPFTELVTADYIMVTPYTARGYGNRLRAWMYYQHFLGVDVMELAPQVTDAAAVDAKFDNPTMEAADCVVCHRTIDPIAGLFQDYYNEDGYYQPRRDGWFTDVFPPGFEGEDLPEEERWRALQWLGARTAEDPRFAVAMVEHVYYILSGRQVLAPPKDIDDPRFAARRRAYREQREMIQEVAEHFADSQFNLKAAFKALVLTPFYRADGLASAVDHPSRQAELQDIGVVRLLGPEQLDRKLRAIFGSGWDDLTGQYVDVRKLLGDGQPRADGADSLSAPAEADCQRRRGRRQREASLPRPVCE